MAENTPRRNLLDWLRDSIWQFVAVPVALLTTAAAIVGAYLIYEWQLDVYSLEAVILSKSSLVSVAEGYGQEIEVRYQGQPVDNLSLVDIKLENTGNQPIERQDFDEPLRFVFPEGTQLLDASVQETLPDDLDLQVSVEGPNVASLAPVLLNSADRGVIRFIAVDLPASTDRNLFDIDARIARIPSVSVTSAIEQSATSDATPRWRGILGVLWGIVLLIGLLALGIVRAINRK